MILHGSRSTKQKYTTSTIFSGVAEYDELVKGASVAIGVRTVAVDVGVKRGVVTPLHSDASAAIGIVHCMEGVQNDAL